MKRCLIFGGAVVDLVMRIHALPKAGDDIRAFDCEELCGGCGYNVACILNEMDVAFTPLFPVGEGFYGDFIVRNLKERGINFCLRMSGKSGHCISLIDSTGERTFISCERTENLLCPEWFSLPEVSACDCAYVAGYQFVTSAASMILEYFQMHKMEEIFFAPGPRVSTMDAGAIDHMFRLGAVFHLNATEAKLLTKEQTASDAAWHIFDKTGAPVIVTLGNAGALLFDAEGQRIIPCYGDSCIDASGAGDAHIAAIIGSRMHGKSWDEAVRIGNVISSHVVMVRGATLPAGMLRKERWHEL